MKRNLLVEYRLVEATEDVLLRREVLLAHLDETYKIPRGKLREVAEAVAREVRERLGREPSCSLTPRILQYDAQLYRAAYRWIVLGERAFRPPPEIAAKLAAWTPAEPTQEVVQPPRETLLALEAKLESLEQEIADLKARVQRLEGEESIEVVERLARVLASVVGELRHKRKETAAVTLSPHWTPPPVPLRIEGGGAELRYTPSFWRRYRRCTEDLQQRVVAALKRLATHGPTYPGLEFAWWGTGEEGKTFSFRVDRAWRILGAKTGKSYELQDIVQRGDKTVYASER
jgi:hypothetical protein